MMKMVLIIDVDDDNCYDAGKFYIMIYASSINKQSYNCNNFQLKYM